MVLRSITLEKEARRHWQLSLRPVLTRHPDDFREDLLVKRASIKIATAITSYRNGRSPRALLIDTLYALGVTPILGIVLLVIRSTFRRLDAIAEQSFKSRIETLKVRRTGSSRRIDVAPEVQLCSRLNTQFPIGHWDWGAKSERFFYQRGAAHGRSTINEAHGRGNLCILANLPRRL
jgi:hypothetical protein